MVTHRTSSSKTQSDSLSICICTFNRADQLAATLDSLLSVAAELQPGDEIIVIDNNSSDHTAEVVEDFVEKLPLRRVFESRQGLSCARNRALQEFQSNLLIFFDDDIIVYAGTLSAYRGVIDANTDAAFLGGRIMVEWGPHSSSWLKSDDLALLNGLLIYYDLGEDDLVYGDQHLLPYGANFALRRELIEKVGNFNENLGVKGNEIGRGEETDYFKRARQAGFGGRYLPVALVGHVFQPHRIQLDYLVRYGRAKGRAGDGESISIIRAGSRIASFAVRGVWQLLKGRRDRFYQCVINIGIQLGMRGHGN